MSTDDTSEYVRRKKSQYGCLRGIRVDGEAGFNLSKCRNIGIEAAQSPVVFTLDADVEVRRKDCFHYWTDKLLEQPDYCILRTVGGGNLFFKKEIWAKAGGYPTFFKNHGYEDWCFLLRAARHGGYKYVPDDFAPAVKHDNRWLGTVKPFRNLKTRQVEDVKQRPGYIDVKSTWEDDNQDTTSLWFAYEKNPEKYDKLEEGLPAYYEI
jgi:hypothetical protein